MAAELRRRELTASISRLFSPEPEVSAELKHARAMREAWSVHRTCYAIEQHGFWSRRVLALENPEPPLPVPAPTKKRVAVRRSARKAI